MLHGPRDPHEWKKNVRNNNKLEKNDLKFRRYIVPWSMLSYEWNRECFFGFSAMSTHPLLKLLVISLVHLFFQF